MRLTWIAVRIDCSGSGLGTPMNICLELRLDIQEEYHHEQWCQRQTVRIWTLFYFHDTVNRTSCGMYRLFHGNDRKSLRNHTCSMQSTRDYVGCMGQWYRTINAARAGQRYCSYFQLKVRSFPRICELHDNDSVPSDMICANQGLESILEKRIL